VQSGQPAVCNVQSGQPAVCNAFCWAHCIKIIQEQRLAQSSKMNSTASPDHVSRSKYLCVMCI
jgi:hypothetical protein